jgi:hypothetical protein
MPCGLFNRVASHDGRCEVPHGHLGPGLAVVDVDFLRHGLDIGSRHHGESSWPILLGWTLLLLLSGVVRTLFSVGLFSHPYPMGSHSFQTRLGLRVIHLVGAGQKKFGPTPEFLSVHGGPSPTAFVGFTTVFAIGGSDAINRNSLRAMGGHGAEACSNTEPGGGHGGMRGQVRVVNAACALPFRDTFLPT